MATLHIVRSWPGSGKSSFAHNAFPGILLLENDMYHMHDNVYDWHKEAMPDAIKWCVSMTRMALQAGMDVVVANTFTKRRFVEAYKKLADECNAKFDVHRCTGNFKNVHGLDSTLVQSFKSSMEDYPGEIFVYPYDPASKNDDYYEVFNLYSSESYGKFPDLRLADQFVASLASTELESEVHIRKIC